MGPYGHHEPQSGSPVRAPGDAGWAAYRDYGGGFDVVPVVVTVGDGFFVSVVVVVGDGFFVSVVVVVGDGFFVPVVVVVGDGFFVGLAVPTDLQTLWPGTQTRFLCSPFPWYFQCPCS
ncbi:hypothetical protein [Streptomyces sp. NPDC002676]